MFLRFIDSTACNSEQRLDNVNQTYLGLACGKLVLHKRKLNHLQQGEELPDNDPNIRNAERLFRNFFDDHFSAFPRTEERFPGTSSITGFKTGPELTRPELGPIRESVATVGGFIEGNVVAQIWNRFPVLFPTA